MTALARGVVRRRGAVVLVFAVLLILSALLAPAVEIRYRLADYLPPDAPSARGYRMMSEAFGEQGSVRVMAENVSLPEALSLKKRAGAVPGVDSVLWLDDAADVSAPAETWDASAAGRYYRRGAALFEVYLAAADADPEAAGILEGLRAVFGPEAAFTGPAVSAQSLRSAAAGEIARVAVFLVPILLLLLTLSSGSWMEPPLFLAVIGAAVLLNMGTNAFLPGVSQITQSMIFPLQTAVSMDYAIFLLHRFGEARAEGRPVEAAMRAALARSFRPILSSALTTAAGFLALCFMRFGLGADMGIVFAKGILFSLAAVLLLLPALTVLCAPLMDKTRHRSFLPSFLGLGRRVLTLKWILPAVLLLAVPAFLAARSMPFLYGESAVTGSGRQAEDTARIEAVFGRYNPVMILLPQGRPGDEAALARDLAALPGVASVQGAAVLASPEVPRGFLPAALTARFDGGTVTRIAAVLDTPAESPAAFAALAALRAAVEGRYGSDYGLTGGTVAAADLRDGAPRDRWVITLFSAAAVWVILLAAFRSAFLPCLLVAVIECAVWLGMAAPYLTGSPVSYLGYIVVSCVQLGATIDYAILYTHQYQEARRRLPPALALPRSVAAGAGPVLTSAAVLSLTGFIVRLRSGTPAVAQIGSLIGRGALFSAFMVLFVLPQLLRACDRLIGRGLENRVRPGGGAET